MVKFKGISSKQEMKRVQAKTLLEIGTPKPKIARKVGISNKTIERLTSRRTRRKKGSGRKKILSQGQKISISNMVSINSYLTAGDLVQKLNLDCSEDTVRRYLHNAGYHHQLINNKESLTDDQMMNRIEWCQDWMEFENFDHVIFTDETGIPK